MTKQTKEKLVGSLFVAGLIFISVWFRINILWLCAIAYAVVMLWYERNKFRDEVQKLRKELQERQERQDAREAVKRLLQEEEAEERRLREEAEALRDHDTTPSV